jgi:putative ATPase
MPDLFEQNARDYYAAHAPLAERMRPRDLDEFVGQEALVGPRGVLRHRIETDALGSMVLWGPPGTGKTTLARIIAARTGRRFVAVSAVSSGVAEIKQTIAEARQALRLEQRGTILFIDEIHRFNKAQQDALLHGVEDGTLVVVGATTENPSFEVTSALLSRMQVLVLEPLGHDELLRVLRRGLEDDERGLGRSKLELTPDGETELVRLAAGDARTLLNFLELAALLARSEGVPALDAALVRRAAGHRAVLYDKTGEEHYNVVSAFIKSMRGSDPDAALYYLARMIEGGEDPLFVARRLVIFASEDVGNADPRALELAVATRHAVEFVGMPEGFFALSQCTLYLAAAEKSNAAGASYARALEDVREHGALAVPLELRNPVTPTMKRLGYGKGYRYPHDAPEGWVATHYLPEELRGRRYWRSSGRGEEAKIEERLARLRARRATEGEPGE